MKQSILITLVLILVGCGDSDPPKKPPPSPPAKPEAPAHESANGTSMLEAYGQLTDTSKELMVVSSDKIEIQEKVYLYLVQFVEATDAVQHMAFRSQRPIFTKHFIVEVLEGSNKYKVVQSYVDIFQLDPDEPKGLWNDSEIWVQKSKSEFVVYKSSQEDQWYDIFKRVKVHMKIKAVDDTQLVELIEGNQNVLSKNKIRNRLNHRIYDALAPSVTIKEENTFRIQLDLSPASGTYTAQLICVSNGKTYHLGEITGSLSKEDSSYHLQNLGVISRNDGQRVFSSDREIDTKDCLSQNIKIENNAVALLVIPHKEVK